MRRRRLFVVVFLLVALLPLRGWAAVAMKLPSFAPAAAATAAATAAAPAAATAASPDAAAGPSAAAPCHAAARGLERSGSADRAPAHATENVAEPASGTAVGSTACVLCDLCHGSALVGPVQTFDGAGPAAGPLRAAAAARLPAGERDPLLRPPRG